MELYNEIQKQAANGFKDMKTARSKVSTHKDVMDPSTGPIKTIMQLPTKKAKIIPIPIPKNYLVQGEAIIICGNAEYRVKDTTKLMKFGERHQDSWKKSVSSSQ